MAFDSKDTAAFKGVWVFCEQREGVIMSTSYQLLSEGRKLANDLGVELCGVLLGELGLGGSGMERHLEKQLGIDLPAGAAITYEDSHGGFHGDGVLTVVVECSDPDKAEGLIDDISQRWRESPIEPELWEQFRAAWRQNGEQIPPLPEEPRGFWFYRDRFQEQYGKKCEFNPVLQNCTFALMDTEQGRLYVLETDF